MSGHAKTLEEYQEAADIILWIRARGQERMDMGNHESARNLAVAANILSDHFLPPEVRKVKK